MKVLLVILTMIPISSFADYRIELGDLTMDMTIDQVVSLKGEPESKIEQADYITDIYKYLNFEAYFNDEHLEGIYTESNTVCTAQDICPGEEVSNAIATYGKFHEKTGGIYEFYSKLAYTCWYRIHTNGPRIKAIEVVCQP